MQRFIEGTQSDNQMRAWLGDRYEHHRRLVQQGQARRASDEQRAHAAERVLQKLRAAERATRHAEAALLSAIIGGLLGLGALSSLMMERMV